MTEEHPIRLRLTSLGLAVLLSLFSCHPSHGQAISEYQVKAAYLYNFAKFVEWPTETFKANTDPIRLCILNDRALETQLDQIVKGRNIAGHPIVVAPVKSGEQSRGCQVLFINSAQNSQTPQIVDVLKGSSVLTVGESKGFIEEGGIINFVLQGDQVRFQINHKAAIQAGLHMSSRLLSLAKLVIE
jgi:hypothetical protein